MTKRFAQVRLTIFLGLICLTSAVILWRIFNLSVVNHSIYARTAKAQNENISNILARGNIYIKDGSGEPFLAATNKKFALAYIVPADVPDDRKADVSRSLAEILKLDQTEILERLSANSKSMRVIARRIENGQIDAIKNLGVKGVGITYELDRFYPAGMFASNVIGFLGYDPEGERSGQYGVEEFYNDELFGQSSDTRSLFGTMKVFDVLNDTFAKITNRPQGEEKAESNEPDIPTDIVLTIDKNVQVMIEKSIDNLVQKWTPEKATIIVQEPISGKIVAMANRPTFDPNGYSKFETRTFLNSAVQEVFEPGSSFKPLTMAIGLDLVKISPDTTYTDPGIVNIGGYDIGNYDRQSHGVKTMTQVLEKSLNTGTMFVQGLIGNDDFLNYVINMGFGQATGIDLPGEVAGNMNNLYSGRNINFQTASFGQGIAVTPIQLINSFSMIANGGKLMRPYVVEKIVKENGEEQVTQPEVVTIPISDKTSAKLKTMLTSVVDHGFDKARIPVMMWRAKQEPPKSRTDAEGTWKGNSYMTLWALPLHTIPSS
jgi:stage V sporulation protein D (sporulation-specific penicillin-binding protein)